MADLAWRLEDSGRYWRLAPRACRWADYLRGRVPFSSYSKGPGPEQRGSARELDRYRRRSYDNYRRAGFGAGEPPSWIGHVQHVRPHAPIVCPHCGAPLRLDELGVLEERDCDALQHVMDSDGTLEPTIGAPEIIDWRVMYPNALGVDGPASPEEDSH